MEITQELSQEENTSGRKHSMTTTTVQNRDKYNKEVMDRVLAEALIFQFTEKH